MCGLCVPMQSFLYIYIYEKKRKKKNYASIGGAHSVQYETTTPLLLIPIYNIIKNN